jgi:predicted nucleotidyltransferase
MNWKEAPLPWPVFIGYDLAVMNRQHDKERRRRGLVDVTVWVPSHKVEAVKRHASRLERRNPIQRDDVMTRLAQREEDIRRFGVVGLSLFGSVGRDEARRDSDIDLLVEFAPGRPSGMFEMIDLKHMLEALLARPVDLVTPATLKPRIKGRVLKEASRVF